MAAQPPWQGAYARPSWQHGAGGGAAGPYGGAAFGKGRGKAIAGKGKPKGNGKHVGFVTSAQGVAPTVALPKGHFSRDAAPPLREEPKANVIASYTYVANTTEVLDVFCPAWCTRTLKESCLAEKSVDLSLERGLAAMQGDDGGFAVNTELFSLLGLGHAASVLALAGEEDARTYGAILALKTVVVYRPGGCSPKLIDICKRAENLVFQTWGFEPATLYQALQSIEDPEWQFPEKVVAAFKLNFATPVRWSFFEMWSRLLPDATRDALLNTGGVCCPRFFLVDMATAPFSFHESEKVFPLLRKDRCLFVGQPPGETGSMHDVMRQGKQLEAAIVAHGWLEEDHLLTQLQLPDALAIYSAAPDALEVFEERCFAQEAPLEAGNTDAYEEAGYLCEETFPHHTEAGKSCRLWRSDIYPEPDQDVFIEVKKTTHLNGNPGRFKLLKYWIQAALAGCGAVVVATTEGSVDGERVTDMQRLSLQELAARVGDDAGRMWANLNEMLKYIFAETATEDGQWTLRFQKPRGPDAALSIRLTRGWDDSVDTGIEHRVALFMDSLVPIA